VIANFLQAGEVPTTESVLFQLTAQFREYKRTSQADLRRVISTTIIQARNASRAISAVSGGAASLPLEQPTTTATEKDTGNNNHLLSSETLSASTMSLNDGLYTNTRSTPAAVSSTENTGDASSAKVADTSNNAATLNGGVAGQKRKRTAGGGGGSKRRGGETSGNPELEDAVNDDGMGA